MKEFLNKAKTKLTALVAGASATVLTVVTASAAESSLSTYGDQITAEFTSAATDIMPIIIGILGAGLSIFALFKGIKLAKRMFGTVSNG